MARLRQRATHNCHDLVEVKGLGQIFVGPLFCGRQGRHQSVLRAHHNDWQVGAQLLDTWNEIEGVFIGHHDVSQHNVSFALAHPVPKR